uniref:RRM domain-containing protein n=1 Tax=Strigamia maritima TaxID=126957 RepID=T1J2X9_STRMM
MAQWGNYYPSGSYFDAMCCLGCYQPQTTGPAELVKIRAVDTFNPQTPNILGQRKDLLVVSIDIFYILGSTSRSWIGSVEVDSRSIFIDNLSYAATAEDLRKHFQHCGCIKQVTISHSRRRSNSSKGVAYIEFNEKYSVKIALALHETFILERAISVSPKRSNRHKIVSVKRIVRSPISGKKRLRGNCDDDDAELKGIGNNLDLELKKVKKSKKSKILDDLTMGIEMLTVRQGME